MLILKSSLKSLLATVEETAGIAVIGRAVTAILRVCADGDDSDGLSIATAYTTLQGALDECDTSDNACTLILISPHGSTHYDIYTTGDPTWSANVILKGSHRNWAKIMNTHASATSILKLTGRSSVIDLNFNLGTGNNGLIQTRGGARTRHCQFVGSNLTGAATALHYDTADQKHFKAEDLDFLGHATHMTALKVDALSYSEFQKLRIHKCLVGVHIVGATADENSFDTLDIGDCAIGLDLDAGNEQHFNEITLHGNTLNIDDEVGDHIWTNIHGAFPITVEPDDMTGVTLTAGADANLWGSDTQIRAAATSTKPFRIVAEYVEPAIAQWYQLRLSDDSGSTWFDRIMLSTSRAAGSLAPSGTEYIFNAGTRISGSVKAESGGNDTMLIWLKIQEI